MHIVFSHGKDGEPWGSKIKAMAEIARKYRLTVESVDYRGIDDPAARVARLLEVCRSLRAAAAGGLEPRRSCFRGGFDAGTHARHVSACAGFLHARL